MRIGWRTYLKRRFRSGSAYHAVGIAIAEESVSFCALKRLGSRFTMALEETVIATNWGEQLSRWVNKHGLSGTPAYVAFSTEWYQLVQIDKPAVADDEVGAALAWSAKELFSQDEAMVFDYIELPVPLAGTNKIDVVGLAESEIVKVCECLLNAGLELQSIGIEELALCDLLPSNDEPVLTLVQEAGQEVCLNIIAQGKLYLTRRLKGFENLASFSEQELQMGIGDSLSVQIQRSMDYFESQLRQPPVRKIRMRLNTNHHLILAEQIKQVVNAEIEEMIPNWLENDAGLLQRVNYTSLGAACAAIDEQSKSTEVRA